MYTYTMEDVKTIINEINSKGAGRTVRAEKDAFYLDKWRVITTYADGRDSYSYIIEDLPQLCQYLAGYEDALN